MDKKVVLTAAIVVAFLLSSSILVLFYNQESEDNEINLVARVNTEGSGIYLDAQYDPRDFVQFNDDGTIAYDDDGKVIYKVDAWRGKIFGTPGPTSIQHLQLQSIVVNDLGLKYLPYTVGTTLSDDAVYHVSNITNAAAFESTSNRNLAGGILWEPQVQAILASDVREAVLLMTTNDFDPGHACCVIGASHEFITSNPQVTVRFLAAYIEAVDWLNAAKQDKSSEEYQYLLNVAADRTGITDRQVLENALDIVTYTYGGQGEGDTAYAPLTSLENDIMELADELYALSDGPLKRTMQSLGFSSLHEFAQRYVNDGYLAQAMELEIPESGYSTANVTVGVISGDIHQIAIHLGMDLGIFDKYGINITVNSAANGGGVATSLQNGEADFGFVGAPPMTIAVINGQLSQS